MKLTRKKRSKRYWLSLHPLHEGWKRDNRAFSIKPKTDIKGLIKNNKLRNDLMKIWLELREGVLEAINNGN